MAINAGTMFPTEVVEEMFSTVRGKSALARLSAERPIPFNGETHFVFSASDEVSVVAEGDAKPAGNGTVTTKVVTPVTFLYQMRVSDKFMKAGDATRLRYMMTFAEGFGRKIARGVDIAAFHGIDPKTKAPASFKATNSFDGLVDNLVTYDAAAIDDNIDAAITAAAAEQITGLALSPVAGAALSKIKVNGVPQYPEFRFGRNPESFYGMAVDVNSTVSYMEADAAKTDHVIVGDFAGAFRWGYAENIPFEVIEYGDPDGTGRDLKQYNEVLLRSEAYVGWGILDPEAFAIVQTA